MNRSRDPPHDPSSLVARVGGIWAGADLQFNFQNEIASLLGRGSRSFPGAQPVSFARKRLQELKHQDYYVCEKTDGLRYLMYLNEDQGKGIHYLIDRKNILSDRISPYPPLWHSGFPSRY
ncbi:mRNA guanylyltransferase [Exophiala aquamarina CBS 119918]|uniref:mRNA guanylyltransferase n=1 Tax=Exophiala aquamarina CBS 119918 TaxID=1182545 RepID=A0A072P6K8_9EURO|nr:mRNA guanylyltransferase [Exophiala aquamarina CBS 119918]KEF51235.1 mRNA guanylyltransferase [Exophiala aquamarina CBS 119918]